MPEDEKTPQTERTTKKEIDPARYDHVMQFFTYKHLPEHLQAISKPFCELAEWIVKDLPRNPQRTIALNKVMEAKDAAVRAALAKD